MQPPSVVIAANPYEAELCRRALVETGLRVVVAEGGEGVLGLLLSEQPLVLVIALGMFGVEPLELLRQARWQAPSLPIFLIGDRDGEIPNEDAAALIGATRLFLRPIDCDSLADAIEKRAVEAEIAEEVSEAMAEFSVRPPTIDAAPLVEESIVELEAEYEPGERAPQAAVARIALRRLPRETTEVVGAAVELRRQSIARADDSEPPHPHVEAEPEAASSPPAAPTAFASPGPPPPAPPLSDLSTEDPPSASAARESSAAAYSSDELDRAWNDPPSDAELAPFEVTLPPPVAPPRASTEVLFNAAPPHDESLSASLPSVALPESRTRPRIFGERAPESSDADQPLLRADDALNDAAGLELGALAGTPDFIGAKDPQRDLGRTPFDERSTLARRLESELSAAEKRLFPDSPSPGSARGAKLDDPYEDALGDIDLDQLGIDTIPGVGGDTLDALRPRNGHGSARDESPSRNDPSRGDPSRNESSRSDQSRSDQSRGDQARNDQARDRSRLDSPRVEAPQDAPAQRALERTPTLPRVPAPVLPDAEGDLTASDIASLLAALHGGGFSGRFTALRSDGEKSIFFDGGLPVFATSTFAHERLAELVFRDGKITRDQLARAKTLPDGGRAAAQKLVELGLIKSSELFATLRHHAEDILFSLFAWDSGRYRLTRELAAPEDRVRLSATPWALIVEGVRRKYGLERLVELVGPPDVVLSPTANLARAVEECAFTAAESARAEAIDGERSLAEIALGGGPPLSEAGLYAVAWSLCAIGAARIGSVEKGFAASGLPTLITPPLNDGDRRGHPRPEARPRDREIDRAVDKERVLAKRAQIDEGDYFAVLGLGRDATAHEVARAFERLKREFAPDRFAESVRGELSDALAEIAEVLDEAQRVLGNADIRAAYRAHLPASS